MHLLFMIFKAQCFLQYLVRKTISHLDFIFNYVHKNINVHKHPQSYNHSYLSKKKTFVIIDCYLLLGHRELNMEKIV